MMIDTKKNYIKKYILLILTIILIIAYFINIDKKDLLHNSKKSEELINIGIVFTKGGLGDKSFNDLCYDGMLRAQEELKINFDYIEPKTNLDYENALRELALSKKYDLIISVGAYQEDALVKISKEFKNQKFTIIDAKVDADNVSSIYTKWNEQTFLSGVMAGLLVKENNNDKTAGIILGEDTKPLREGALGFEAGFRYINPQKDVFTVTIDNFFDPSKAKEASLLMYSKGAEYIQHLSGASGLGVFSAANEVDKYAFGVDGNENYFEPDNIVATSTRYSNILIYNEIKDIVNNKWRSGLKEYGLKENIIGYTRIGSNVYVSEDIINKVEYIKKDIIDKKLIIPSNKEELDIFIKNNRFEN